MEFYRFPCEVFTIDAADIMGNEESDVKGELVKIRLSKDGK